MKQESIGINMSAFLLYPNMEYNDCTRQIKLVCIKCQSLLCRFILRNTDKVLSKPSFPTRNMKSPLPLVD